MNEKYPLTCMGCDKFIICGGAGCLQKDMAIGNLILPTTAVRDEGTSYHYLPPSREVACNPETIKTVKEVLDSILAGMTVTLSMLYSCSALCIIYMRKKINFSASKKPNYPSYWG